MLDPAVSQIVKANVPKKNKSLHGCDRGLKQLYS